MAPVPPPKKALPEDRAKEHEQRLRLIVERARKRSGGKEAFKGTGEFIKLEPEAKKKR